MAKAWVHAQSVAGGQIKAEKASGPDGVKCCRPAPLFYWPPATDH
jgi:hypothetical protein